MQRCSGLGDQPVQPHGGAGPRPGAEVQPVAGTPGVPAAAPRDGGALHTGAVHDTKYITNVCTDL